MRSRLWPVGGARGHFPSWCLKAMKREKFWLEMWTWDPGSKAFVGSGNREKYSSWSLGDKTGLARKVRKVPGC